jgi:hypothetical protein
MCILLNNYLHMHLCAFIYLPAFFHASFIRIELLMGTSTVGDHGHLEILAVQADG